MLSTCIREQWGWPEASCRPVGWSWWRKGACRHHPLISCWAKSLWSEILACHCPSVQLPTTHILSFISQTAICLPWHTSTWLQSICVIIISHQRNNIWLKGRSSEYLKKRAQSVSLHTKLMVYEIYVQFECILWGIIEQMLWRENSAIYVWRSATARVDCSFLLQRERDVLYCSAFAHWQKWL